LQVAVDDEEKRRRDEEEGELNLAVSLLSRQKPIDSFRLQTEEATLWIKSSRWAVCCLSGGCQTQEASKEKLGKRGISSPFRLVSSPCDRRWIISIRFRFDYLQPIDLSSART